MRKYLLTSLLAIFFLGIISIENNAKAQTTSLTITYTGFQACGGCTVCGADYWCFNTLSSYCGNTGPCGTQAFIDPVPAGNIVTNIQVQYYSAQCSGGSLTASINGNPFPTVNEAATGCLCSNNPCAVSASTTNTYPCGIPAYNYGASNNLQLCTGADVCINALVLIFTYAPANQATPATQPAAISGPTPVCVGTQYTYSVSPPVANASSYNWTFPPGWVINSGAGTATVTATPGTAGNICVTASNLCGTSAATCFPVTLSTPSTAPASASANPTTVCAPATSTLTVNGGSLGAGASWTWYSGSCGGTFEGTGTSITVSPSSTTTYFVQATGGCGNTSCVSTAVTVAAPTSPFTTNTATQCLTGNNFVFTNTGTSGGGVTQTWDFGDGVGSSTSVDASYSYSAAGTYTVTHTVFQGSCNSVTTTVVTVSPLPDVNAGSTNQITCSNTSALLSGSSLTGGVTLTWDGPGLVGAPDPATTTSAGTYTITANSSGCTNTATIVVTSNTTPPNTGITAPNTTIDCANPSVTLTGTSSTGGAILDWTGPSGAIAGNPISVGSAGTYTLTVTDPSNGCTATQTQAVTSNGAVPNISMSTSDDTLTCTVTSITLTGSSSTSGATLGWDGPSGPIAGNPISSSTAGTYTLTVTDPSSGCSVTQTFSIAQSTAVPSANATASAPSITCVVLSSTLTGSSGASNASYSWNGPSGALAGNPVAVSSGGTYTVTVTDNSNGCTATQTVSVATDTTSPAVTITPSNTSITCANTTATLTGNASNVTYSWSGAGSGTTSTQTASAPGNYILTVTDNTNGCTNSASATVAIDTTSPNASALANGSLTCQNLSTSISGNSTTSGATYSWAGPGGFTSASQNPSVSAAGNYTVTVTDPANGCTNTATVSVTTNVALPNVNAGANDTLPCGAGATINLNGSSSTAGVTYSWSGPGGFTSTSQNPSISATGQYTLTVTDPSNGCSDSATVNVIANVALPNVNAGANDTLPCGPGATVNLNGSSSTAGVTYSWSGPGGFTSTSQNPSISATGQYTLTVTDPSNGCSDSATVDIIVDSVTAGFTASPTTGVVPLTVTFTNTSTGATSYTWSFGDGNTSTGVNPTDIYGVSGTYTVILIASNANCSDTATATIVVNDNFSVIIPNVFTPNGDGSNDVFFVTTTGVVELTGDIFNRWGEKIYSLVGINAGWDGKNLSGTQVSSGTYYLLLRLKGADGTIYEREAYIGLFR